MFPLLWVLLCYHRCAERRYHNVPGIWDGGVHSPESHLISHEVDVRGAPPAVGECVVVPGSAQAPLEEHAARAEMILHLERHTTLLYRPFSHFWCFSVTVLLLPGCCSGACCSTGTRCKPRGRFQPTRGATGAAQSSGPLQSLPWFCTPARAGLYSSRPWTTPEGRNREKQGLSAREDRHAASSGAHTAGEQRTVVCFFYILLRVETSGHLTKTEDSFPPRWRELPMNWIISSQNNRKMRQVDRKNTLLQGQHYLHFRSSE